MANPDSEQMRSNQASTNYGQLSQRAYLFLERQGGKASQEALIHEVFQVRGRGKVEVWGGILAQVLADPHRFRRLPSGEWCLTVQTDAARSLLDLEYVVIDCETTGLDPQQQRVIEVAAIRLRGGQRVETFETLINPQRRIPEYITHFTGISNGMTANAPGFEQIAGKLCEFIGSAIVVGHNIPFDIRFLDGELRRLQLSPLLNETVDTISLALRLYPGMKRPNLDRLVALVGLSATNRHRAYGDASLTSDAFLILLKQAAAKGYTTLADLRAGRPRKEELGTGEQVSGIGGQVPVGQRFEDLHPLPVIQHPIPDTLFEMPLPEPEAELEEVTPEPEEEILSRPAQMPSRPRYRPEIASLTNRATARARYLLSKDLLRDLPEKPGVYLMKDSGGTVIYVGKAKNLYHRVSSYYSQPLGYTRKLDGLIESIDRIDHIVVGSELEALLLESKLIKRYLPRYNTQQRNYEAYPFIKIDLSQRFPRIYSCREILDDGARYFGPFKSRRAVETTVEIIEQFFPIRTCTRSFEWETLNRKRRLDSPCLRESLKRCPGPCTGSYSDEAHHGYMLIIEEVINFLSGEKQTMLDTLWERLQKASKNEDYERAAALRDGYQQVEKIIGSQKFLAAAVEGNNVLIALPSIETGAVELLCIYRGRLGRQVRLLLDAVPSGDTLAQIWQELAARESELAANQPGWGKHGGRVIGKEAVDEINLIARWLYTHTDDSGADDHLILPVPAAPVSPTFWHEAVRQILKSYSL